jgi:hypothetical protein
VYSEELEEERGLKKERERERETRALEMVFVGEPLESP